LDLYIRMLKNKKKKSRISPSVTTTICALVILIGGFFLSYNYIQAKKIMAYDYMANVFYTSNTNNIIVDDGTRNNEEETVEEEVTDEYIGYLNIPKINLTKGFYSKNSKENDIDKNILVIKESSYPDVEKGNLIIAGHSGNSWRAFFNDLYKLSKGDYAYVTYKNKKYAYKIVNIYKQDKVGTIGIYRDYNKTTLTLVTCTNYESTTQTVYIAELQEVTDN